MNLAEEARKHCVFETLPVRCEVRVKLMQIKLDPQLDNFTLSCKCKERENSEEPAIFRPYRQQPAKVTLSSCLVGMTIYGFTSQCNTSAAVKIAHRVMMVILVEVTNSKSLRKKK